jgi:hypothetical protein
MRALSLPVHLLLTHPQEADLGALMKNPIRNETSLVLVVAVVFSAVAIPVLSGFLEPSQPPAVAAIQIGEPREGAGDAARNDAAGEPGADRGEPRAAEAQRRRATPRQANPAQSAPSGDAEDDGGDD